MDQNIVINQQEYDQYQQQQAALLQLQQQNQQLQNQLQQAANNNNNNQPRLDNIPFPVFYTPEGKQTMTAKVYINQCNLYFNFKQGQGQVYNGIDKARMVQVYNTQGVVANYLSNVIPAPGSVEAVAFSWDTFCDNFIREFTDIDEEQVTSNALSKVSVTTRANSLTEALQDYHNKMREWKGKLTHVGDNIFRFQYINKLPSYLNAALTAHLSVINKKSDDLTLNELFAITMVLAKQYEPQYRQHKADIDRMIKSKYRKRDFNPRGGNSSTSISAINTSSNNTVDSSCSIDTTSINAVYSGDKRMRGNGNGNGNGTGDSRLWFDKIRPYCIERGLCFRCKQPLAKSSDGKIIRHPRGSCKPADLPPEVMQSFQRGQ